MYTVRAPVPTCLACRRYGGILALAELGELLFGRLLAVCRSDRLRYFNRALRPMKHWAARVAFIIVASHMLHDGMVALVMLEPTGTITSAAA